MAIKQLNDLSVDGDLTVSGGGTFQTPVTIDSDGSADNYYLNFSENGSSRFTIYENSNNIYFNGWAGHTIFRPRMAGSGSFAVLQGNTQFDTSGNATFAGNLTVTGGTITLGGTSFTKESVFITRTPTVGTGSDWDDFIQQGTYGVASSGGAQFTGDNRPVATKNGVTFEPDYRYGHLVVTEDSSGQGIQQTYYPHSGNQKVFTRTGWSDSSWGNWTMNWNTANMGSGSNLDADTLDGEHASAFVLGTDVDAGQVAFGDGTGLNGDGHLYWDSTNNRLGIGTTSPAADIHIEDAGSNTSGLRFSAIGTGNQDNVNMHFQGSAGSAPFYISRAQTGGAEIQLQRDGDIILNGSNGDNTGIGTTQPQQKLHVNGNILCGGHMYFNTGTSNYISGIGGGLEWYTDGNKIVDVTYNGDVEVTNNLDIGNTKLLTWGALGGTIPTTYIQGQDNSSKISLVGNFTSSFSNSTEGHIVFKNSNNNGTTSGTVGLVADIVTDSTAIGSISTNIRFGRASNMQYGYNKYTGAIEYISTNNTSGEKMIFKCAQYSFLQANGSPSSGVDSIKIGGNTNNQIGYIDLWGDSGGGKPFFNIQDTRYQPSTSLSNPVVRIQNNFHSTNSRYQIVFQRYSATSSIRGSIATNNSGTTYNTTSDYRLKTDAKDFNALDLVKQIPVYDFKWKNIENRDYGCFAHELGEVIPNAVHGEKDALTEDGDKDYQQADYSKLVPVLVKAIQELEAKVKILENK